MVSAAPVRVSDGEAVRRTQPRPDGEAVHRSPAQYDRSVPELETRCLINGEQVAGEGLILEVENPYTEEVIASVGSAERRARRHRDRRRAGGLPGVGPDAGGRPGRAPARGGDPPAGTYRRARRGDDPGGRQAARRELRRGRLGRRLLRLLRRDRPRLRRPGDPIDRVEPALARHQGAPRRDRLHRPVELPAAPARLEDGAGARRRQCAGRQAIRADAALDADAGPLSRSPAAGRRQPDRRRASGRGGDR